MHVSDFTPPSWSSCVIGRTIAHYRIHAKLGEGGMGVVYRARDLSLGREVALKFLPADMVADPQARRRLRREAQAASLLNHPNIAIIYEVNEWENAPFISMEFVTGQTLKQILRRGGLAPAQFVSIAHQIAEGLQAAHCEGVYHRDIKPSNIMLDSASQVKILDFGLAASGRHERAAGESEDTRTLIQNSAGGTVPYMSPEQLRGEPADARSDIFSFGVLLYECLSGHLPFRGETAIDVLHAILHEPHKPLPEFLPDISPEWEHLVNRCLVKSAGQRCASMDEVLDALRGVAAPALRPEKSLAVLYFANLSRDKDDEYFRDGMTEDIITELAKIKDLQIFPRSAVFAFRDNPLTVAQISHHLAVAYVLDGSIRRAGNRLRITTQLAETRTGHSVWAERYDRQLEDVFAIQDEIAQNIARALRVMLTEKEKREIEKVPTSEVQAYDYYLRGRQFFYQMRRNGFEFARQMFAGAIAIDPGYARAYAGVADCCSLLYMWFEPTKENLSEAVATSCRAIELDPESAEAHASRGLAESLSMNYEGAKTAFETSIRLNPTYSRLITSTAAHGLLKVSTRKPPNFSPRQAARIQTTTRLAPCWLAAFGHWAARKSPDKHVEILCGRQNITCSFTPTMCALFTWGPMPFTNSANEHKPSNGPAAPYLWTPRNPLFFTTSPAPTRSSGKQTNPSIAWRRRLAKASGTGNGSRTIPTSHPCSAIHASRP